VVEDQRRMRRRWRRMKKTRVEGEEEADYDEEDVYYLRNVYRILIFS